jgi:hypothetical protein
MKRLVAALVGAALVAAPAIHGAAQGVAPGPVFMLELIQQLNGQYRGVEGATGFLISKDGTALTAGHLASRVGGDYSLLAIVDGALYSTQVVCKTPLPAGPPNGGTEQFARDVSEIRLTPSTYPFTTPLENVNTT